DHRPTLSQWRTEVVIRVPGVARSGSTTQMRRLTPQHEERTMLQLMALLSSLQARVEDREHGQGMVEYGLIIAAVAIAVIVALFTLGPKIASMFSSTSASLK